MDLAARRVHGALEASPSASDRPRSDHLSGEANGLHAVDLRFHRPGTPNPIFTGLTFDVLSGQTLALAGPGGSGKSTVLLTAAGLLSPTAGHIRWGALDVSAWPQQALRHHLTLVPQRAALMSGTIRQALTLAVPQADDASLWTALSAVALDGVIQSKRGLDFTLGPQRAGLSGGEARRLVLPRALLRKPAILLLDEPTEGLDDATARKVLDGIRRYLPHAAILTASHRRLELDWARTILTLSGKYSTGRTAASLMRVSDPDPRRL